MTKQIRNLLGGAALVAMAIGMGVLGALFVVSPPSPTAVVEGERPAADPRCGDGACDAFETSHPAVCPGDCDGSDEGQVVVTEGTLPNTYFVTNPATGNRLYVAVTYPGDGTPDASVRPVVLVPGSTESSGSFTAARGRDPQTLADLGFAVYAFDPEGRGRSDGEENDNGFDGQDGLAAVIQFASESQSGQSVGILSFSYGITMSTGALSRNAELPVAFLIDWEGPSDRNDTGGCDEDDTGHLKDAGCGNEAFWAEREAVRFVGSIHVPYLRVQTQTDHAQPDVRSAARMINAAVAGTTPWVRLNDGTVGATYDESALPTMLPDSIDRSLFRTIGAYAMELFAR